MADDNRAQDGRGNFGNTEQHRAAGEAGGKQTAKKGSEFYSEIGSKQGKDNNPGNFANDPEKASRAGKEGGSK